MATKIPKVIMITGAAGYVGAMLCDQFSKCPGLQKIIAVDMKPMPELLKDNKKIVWITSTLDADVWKRPALINRPEVIIHCAWQIKELFHEKDLQRRLNIDGSRAVFEFVFDNNFVKKFIDFSTVSSYGAYPENGIDEYFTEDDPLREDEYLYGVEKKEAEEMLRNMYESRLDVSKQVFVVRPSSITGPRGRTLPGKKFGLLNMLKDVLPMIPVASDKWCRQYIHEDDVTDIVAMFTFSSFKKARSYEVYNITPNDLVTAGDMVKLFGKSILRVPEFLVKTGFFLLWNILRGKVGTSPGGWKFFCFPIVVDGSRITERHGFEYSYTSHEALEKNEGRYAEDIIKRNGHET